MSEEILSADMSTPSRPAVTPQAVVGVSICLMGIALTLDNFGIYELRSFAELWPIVPISIGVLTLMYGETRQDWVKGTLWLALGIFFIFRHPLIREVWPLVLIGLGGYLVWRSRTGPPPARKWQAEVRLETDDPYTHAAGGAYEPTRPDAAGSDGRRPPGEPSVPGGVGAGIASPEGRRSYLRRFPRPTVRRVRRAPDRQGPGRRWGPEPRASRPVADACVNAIRERKRSRWGCTTPTGAPRRRRRPDASRSAPRTRGRAPNTRLAPSGRVRPPAAASVPRCSR